MPMQEDLLRIRQRALASEAPYGRAGFGRDPAIFEYDDPRNETATGERWRDVIAQHGAQLLGPRDVPRPDEIIQLPFEGMLWKFRLLEADEDVLLPTTGHNRLRALEAAGVPFAWFIYADETYARPRFTAADAIASREPGPQVRPAVQRGASGFSPASDPTAEMDEADWGMAIAHWANRVFTPAESAPRTAPVVVPVPRKRDPLLIGVIPTGPARGQWVLIAKWYH